MLLTNRKAKKLASLLRKQLTVHKRRTPYIQSLVFLSDPAQQCKLTGPARENVPLRADIANKLFDETAPIASAQPIARDLATSINRALETIGIRPPPQSRRVGDYQLEQVLAETDFHQDWLAKHVSLTNLRRRVRLYTAKRTLDVRTINETQLAAMGVDEATMRAFVTNRWFTPTLSVPFVESLAQIPNATGRSAVVALASTAASESEARFMVNAVSMARRVGTAADPVVAVDLDGWILVVRTRGGRVEVPAPVDYVVWTDTVEAMASRNMQGGQRNVLVSGLASTRAREGLQATGWALQEHARR